MPPDCRKFKLYTKMDAITMFYEFNIFNGFFFILVRIFDQKFTLYKPDESF